MKFGGITLSDRIPVPPRVVMDEFLRYSFIHFSERLSTQDLLACQRSRFGAHCGETQWSLVPVVSPKQIDAG